MHVEILIKDLNKNLIRGKINRKYKIRKQLGDKPS